MSDGRQTRDPLGAVLRHLVDNTRDLTREDIAMVGGVDQSQVSRWLSGQHPVPLNVAVGLARIGFPELVEEACQRAGGRYCREGCVAQERVSSTSHALSISAEVAAIVSNYVTDLAHAAADGIVTQREHRGLQERARRVRTVGERLERSHRASASTSDEPISIRSSGPRPTEDPEGCASRRCV